MYQVKQLVDAQASHTEALVFLLATLVLIHLPVKMPGKTGDNGPCSWVLATDVGDEDEVPQ